MSDAATRTWISLIAACAVLGYGFWTVAWVVTGLCEFASDEQRQTVRCDHERGQEWRIVQGVLLLAAGLVLAAGIAWALKNASFRAVLAGMAVAAAMIFGVYAINDIGFEAKPAPRLSAVRLLDRRCVEPCDAGVRVAFTIDRTAQVAFLFGPEANNSVRYRPYRQTDYGYISGVLREAGARPEDQVEFEAGEHMVRVGGFVEITAPREGREPLPPGLYNLAVEATLPDAGSQPNQSSEEFSFGVRIQPRRG